MFTSLFVFKNVSTVILILFPIGSRWLQSEYFEGLKREIGQFWKSLCREESFCGAFSDDGTDRVFADTLFLGGGTPSSVDPALIEDLMRYIRAMKSEGSGNEIDRGDCAEEKGGCERENDLPQICARGEEYASEGAPLSALRECGNHDGSQPGHCGL